VRIPQSESQTRIIESISAEFTRHRAEKGGHFPEPLKRLIVSGIEVGVSKARLARASGLSKATILLWSRKFSVLPVAKELKIRDDDVPSIDPAPFSRLICVRLRSGVEIEFPHSDLNFEFLSMLNGLGGVR
jgi:hypothetical protein